MGILRRGSPLFAKCCKKSLDGYTHICLDDYRRVASQHHGLTLIQREEMSKSQCMADIRRTSDVIFETVACSRFWDEIQDLIYATGDHILFVKVSTPPSVCIRRNKQRKSEGYVAIPPPFVSGSIEDAIYHIHDKMRVKHTNVEYNTMAMSTPEMVNHFLNTYILVC